MEASSGPADRTGPSSSESRTVLVPPGPAASAAETLGDPGGTLLVAFGGLLQPRGTSFEFDRLTDRLADHRVLLRDHERCWYQRGLSGITDDVEGVGRYLRDVIARCTPDRVVFVGASAGGFAAIRFGAFLNVDETHAFAPQTFIGTALMQRFREPRWRAEGRKVDATAPRQEDIDLAAAIAAGHRTTAHHVWYCGKTEEDVVHATHVAASAGVRLHCLPEGEHLVVKWLRDRGLLAGVLRDAVDGVDRARVEDEIDPVSRRRVRKRTRARRRLRIVRADVRFRLGRGPRQFF